MKSCSTIDLIKTPNGYSLIQNQTPINKVSSMSVSTSMPPTALSKSLPKQKSLPQPSKKFIPQQNFTIYPYIYSSKLEQTQHKNYLLLPIKSQWFQLNLVSEIQRKAMPEWFKQKKTTTGTNVINTAKFQKNQELYKKYRNHIIEMGKAKYVTATMARKGLAGDVCSIIRIHHFLENWGLINYLYKKPSAESKSIQGNGANLVTKPQQQAVSQNCPKRRDGFERDKALISKLYQKEDLQLLKKLTKHYRPPCDSCMAICGVFWYEYSEQLVKKQFVQTQQGIREVKSTQPIDYSLRICYSCYYEKNYPVVLGYEDFQKISVIEKFIESGEKRLNGTVNAKKKQQENAKVVDSVERHRFNLKQCGEELKMSQKQLLDTLMQVPIQTMGKLSRLQPETQDQQQHTKPSPQPTSTNAQSSTSTHQPCPWHPSQQQSVTQSLTVFKSNLQSLHQQQTEIYEEFLQSWLLKMYCKLQKLQKWDKSINWKLTENQTVMKFNIAEKVRKMVKIQDQ